MGVVGQGSEGSAGGIWKCLEMFEKWAEKSEIWGLFFCVEFRRT
jgi:hypothetical protein